MTASAAATTGVATVTVTGTSGSLTRKVAINLTVTAAPSYTLSATPSTLDIAQGSQGKSTISISPLNGFDGSVTLSASGLPSGVTATFNPDPASSSSMLIFTASAAATTGAATVTVTGISGSLTRTLNLTVIVGGSYTLSAAPNTLSVAQGGESTSTITVMPLNGFNANVTLSATGLPVGVTASFSQNPATSTCLLTLEANSSAATGTATITITGTSGSLSATTTLALNVTALPTFTMAISPQPLTIEVGTSGITYVGINPMNGFDSNVTLTASGLPTAVTASFSPNPTLSSSTLTLDVSSSAATGLSTIAVTGVSGSLSQTTSFLLRITPK